MACRIDVTGAPDISRNRDQDALRKWIEKANPGDAVIYHMGDHCAGKFKSQALAMAQGGLVDLVQVRSQKSFAYVAIKRRKVSL